MRWAWLSNFSFTKKGPCAVSLLTIFLRLAITLTFLILAAGGPYALIMLRRFIRRYTVAHQTLEKRVTALEEREEGEHGDTL